MTLNLEVVICEVGREGRGVNQHSTWKLSFVRWGGRGGGGVDRHSTWKLSFVRWGRRGGEGGSINTEFVEQKNKCTISKKCIS